MDVEKTVQASSGVAVRRDQEAAGAPAETVEPEVRIIERPVYLPQTEPSPGAVPKGRAAVEQANRQGTVQPQDYSKAAMIYDYHRDFVYEIFCQPLRITDLYLKPNEKVVEAPFVSDSERWMLGAGVSHEEGEVIQHIYVKPTEASLEATLIINTNERVYHLILRSYANMHMPMARWRYQEALPKNYSTAAILPDGTEAADPSFLADPRFLSFDYRITRSIFSKPRWMPVLAYDDGKKTYITFPDEVLQAELPTVFENRADILNYRVARNVMILDKLIEQITVKIGSRSVVVEKKRRKP